MKPEDHESLDQTDERLFDYLDGRLDAEAAQGMRMRLENDPEWKSRLEGWTELRAAVRQSSELSDDVKLPAGFADRVVDEAIRRARAEGYDDRHPLIMAGGSAANVSTSSKTKLPVARVAMALAAALMAVVGVSVALRDADAPSSDPNFIAQSLAAPGPAGMPTVDAQDIQPDSPESGSLVAGSVGEGSSPQTRPMVASDLSREVAPTDRPAGLDDIGDASDDRLAPGVPNGVVADADLMARPERDGSPESKEGLNRGGDRSLSPSSMVALGGADAASDALGGADAAAEALGAVLVVEVQCRPGIRGDLLIRDAMRASGMSVAKQHEISDELFEVAADASGVPDDVAFEMIYVSATTSRFQRLYAALMSDTQAVRSVGLSLATEAPIVEAVQSASSVAAVRRGEVAVPIIVRKESGVVDSMDGLQFIPVGKPSDLTAMSSGVGQSPTRGATASAGSLEGDEAAQAILIAR